MYTLLALAGPLLSLVGAWLAAIEIVLRFRGEELKTTSGYNSTVVKKTPEFVQWSKRRERYILFGLALVTIGAILQMVSSCLQMAGLPDQSP
jgi:hypothetical protein